MTTGSSKDPNTGFDKLAHFREVQSDYFKDHGHSSEIHQYQKEVLKDRYQTDFMKHDLKTIKSMVADGKSVDGVDGSGGVAEAWDKVHDALVGAKATAVAVPTGTL